MLFPIRSVQTRKGYGAAPTFPRSFLLALSFSHHVLGLKGVQEAIESGRVCACVHACIHTGICSCI